MLAKCDLVTGMVGEFPELQGIMGRYYALSDKEPDDVADAIAEHYLPRFAGDDLPASVNGQVLAVADRLDTLAGVFSIGKKPSGNRDPFGLRRAALGTVRILVERGIDVDLKALIAFAVEQQPQGKADESELAADLYGFVTERLRRYFLDRDSGLRTETFDAVMAREPDFKRRGEAGMITSFVFRVRNIPAALYKAMGGFATNGVNMTKLESYMVGGQFTATQFYAEVEGHPDDRNVQLAMEELDYFTDHIRLMGVFPAAKRRHEKASS